MSGKLLFAGGINGSSTITGGGGNVTIFGNAGTDVTYFGTAGSAILFAGAGSETLNATFASSGTELVGGSGSSLLLSGSSGNNTLLAGTGASTVVTGGNSNIFFFIDGQAGGQDVIAGFNATDTVVLSGYGASGIASALGSATTSAGGTTITLPDNTKVTFAEFSGLDAHNFISF